MKKKHLPQQNWDGQSRKLYDDGELLYSAGKYELALKTFGKAESTADHDIKVLAKLGKAKILFTLYKNEEGRSILDDIYEENRKIFKDDIDLLIKKTIEIRIQELQINIICKAQSSKEHKKTTTSNLISSWSLFRWEKKLFGKEGYDSEDKMDEYKEAYKTQYDYYINKARSMRYGIELSCNNELQEYYAKAFEIRPSIALLIEKNQVAVDPSPFPSSENRLKATSCEINKMKCFSEEDFISRAIYNCNSYVHFNRFSKNYRDALDYEKMFQTAIFNSIKNDTDAAIKLNPKYVFAKHQSGGYWYEPAEEVMNKIMSELELYKAVVAEDAKFFFNFFDSTTIIDFTKFSKTIYSTPLMSMEMAMGGSKQFVVEFLGLDSVLTFDSTPPFNVKKEKILEFCHNYLVKQEPENAYDSYLQVARILDRKGEVKEALSLCNKAIDLNQKRSEAYKEIMKILDNYDGYRSIATTLKSYNEKIEEAVINNYNKMEEYLKTIDSTIQEFRTIANIACKAANYEEAIGIYRKITTLYPKLIDVQGDLADTYLAAESPENAYQIYEEVLKSHPNHKGALAGISKINEQEPSWSISDASSMLGDLSISENDV